MLITNRVAGESTHNSRTLQHKIESCAHGIDTGHSGNDVSAELSARSNNIGNEALLVLVFNNDGKGMEARPPDHPEGGASLEDFSSQENNMEEIGFAQVIVKKLDSNEDVSPNADHMWHLRIPAKAMTVPPTLHRLPRW